MATSQKQEVYDYVNTFLGGGMIDVELDPIHYQTALTKALTRFRQRSDNSVEESYMFLTTVVDQNEYILPNEVIEVRKIHRRSIGSRTGGGDGGSMFEPFNLAYTNTVNIPVNKNAHHVQLPATPFCLTMSETKLGVSAENVVATIDTPNNHQGIFLPERKNSDNLSRNGCWSFVFISINSPFSNSTI